MHQSILLDDVMETEASPPPPPQPEFHEEDMKGTKYAMASIAFIEIILLIMTIYASTRLWSGRPPKMYRAMIEQAPSIMDQHKEKSRRCQTWVVMTCALLALSQLLKIGYLLCLYYNLEQERWPDMLGYTPLFEISSLAALYGAYSCDIHFWLKTHINISSQA